MESKAFRICPFCQSATPVSDDRCVGCRRSLVGLSLPVYGSEIDAALARPAPAALVDLPLRDAPKPVAAEPRPRSQPRGTKAIVAFAIVLAAIVGVLVVRGHGRPSPPARTASTLPPPAAERPMSDVDTARAPSREPAEPAPVPVPARLPEGV